MKKRNIILVMMAVIIVLAVFIAPKILFPKYEEPEVTGNHEVCVMMDTWEDETRKETYSKEDENRFVTVKFWYPKEEGNYPLVVFSHGATGVIDSNYSTCKELASNGYVVVSIGHPYQAIYVEDINGKKTFINGEFCKQVMTDNVSDTPEHENAVYENTKEWLEVRTGDMNFVLDTIIEKCKLNEADVFTRIDLDKIGLFGHSLGGATAVAVGRERDDIDAVIDLEGTMLGEYVGYENGEYIVNNQPYPIPLLDVNSSAVYEEAAKYADSEYVNFYVGRNAVDFHEVVFHDVSHLNFTDLPLVSPAIAKMLGTGDADARECIETVNDMVLHYFNYYLKDTEALLIEEEYFISSK